jgi:predicted DNA-binding transcriptional regulator AlpA
MLQALKDVLLQLVKDIDAGNSNITEDEAMYIARMMNEVARRDRPMSKYQAYTYLNISRATFDNHVREGIIPKGRKVQGSRELRWYKKDLPKPKPDKK